MGSRNAVRCLLTLGLVALAGAARAESSVMPGDAGLDAPYGCERSTECAPPTPHCSPTVFRCVECLSDRNCAPGEVCSVAEGTCSACRSDADCPALAPYCTAAGCVECTSDVNCGVPGVECSASGLCGSCGDGICGPGEMLLADVFGAPFGPRAPGATTICPEDCAALCPSMAFEGRLGTFSIPTTDLRDVVHSFCGGGGGGLDAFFQWKAPRAGTFSFTSPGAMVTSFEGGCDFLTGASCGPDSVVLQVAEEQAVVVIVDPGAGFAGSAIELTVAEATEPPEPVCEGGSCGAGDGGSDQGKALCLGNARDRGETVCAGVECACSHCGQDYDDCAVIPGCAALRACMTEKGCVGAECYTSGACRAVIDSYGGLSGPAFRAGSGLQSCALTFDCALPCDRSDGGTPGPGEPADAGPLCEPGREVACTCAEAGSGTKICLASGQAFSVCSCPERAVAPARGCDCAVTRTRSPGGMPPSWLATGLLVVLPLRRWRWGGARRAGARP